MTAPLIFITGASSGIGQALAARFHRAGYRLALVARRTAEVQAWAMAQGFDAATFAVYAADVRDVEAIVGAGKSCIAAQGLPDVVIAAAGIFVIAHAELKAATGTNLERPAAAVRARGFSEFRKSADGTGVFHFKVFKFTVWPGWRSK